ncbi:hypothetical protein Tco_0080076 [Tanacetum coccineum]
MKRGFRGVPRPLLPVMLLVANPNAGQEHSNVAQSQPSSSTIPEPSSLPHKHSIPPPRAMSRDKMTLDDLLQVVPQLMTRVDSLEKDLKQTNAKHGRVYCELVKKGDEVEGLVTPSKTNVNTSGEEQVEDISPTTLEAANQHSWVGVFKSQRGKLVLLVDIRLDTLEKKKEDKHSNLDSLLSHKEVAEEDELNESTKEKKSSKSGGHGEAISAEEFNYKPIKYGYYKIHHVRNYCKDEKGVYQIVREDGADIVYINFRAMLKDITRDDLTKLYRIVMNRYGVNGLKDELEKSTMDMNLSGGKGLTYSRRVAEKFGGIWKLKWKTLEVPGEDSS